jgi:hypothetical protein
MKDLSPALAAHLAATNHISARLLLWITARNRTTGAAESLGLWTGEDTRDFTIGGSTRTYLAAGSLLQFGKLTSGTGLDVRILTVTVSGVAPAALQALRGYDARLAPVEVHRAVFQAETAQLIEEPRRVFLGTLDGEPLSIPARALDAAGGGAGEGPAGSTFELKLASSARALTRTLSLRKSDEATKARSGDRGRRWSSVAGRVVTWWGQSGQ